MSDKNRFGLDTLYFLSENPNNLQRRRRRRGDVFLLLLLLLLRLSLRRDRSVFLLPAFFRGRKVFSDTVVQKYVNWSFFSSASCIVKQTARQSERKSTKWRNICAERNPVSVVAYYIVVLIGYVLALDFFSGFRIAETRKKQI